MSALVADITIAGSGPAGLALAAALSDRGARVVVVDPQPDAEWPNRYGAWEQDLDGLSVPVSHRWTSPVVDLGNGPQALPGTYTWLDRPALRQQLLERIHAAGGKLIAGRVLSTRDGADATHAHLADGEHVQSHLVVDATGRGALVQRRRAPRAFQAAAGRLIRAQHPWSTDQAVFMDFTGAHLPVADRVGSPTFLYALPLDDEHVFVEETSLAAAPAVPFALLQRRLDQRLAHLGVHTQAVLDTESCLIPMDAEPPVRGRTLAVGAAAGWAHPATGYQITRSLHQAAAVADALVQGLNASPDQAAKAAWDTIWPAAHLRTRALHNLGLSLLLDLDSAKIQAFFNAFFAIPEPRWRAYFDATSSPTQVAAAMTRVFATLPTALQATVARHALVRGRVDLMRAITPQTGGAL